MRPGGGKQKGAAFEREVCKKLSLWLSDGKQEDVLWRSAMSGGRSTVAAKKGQRLAAQAGDITCIHPCGQAFMNKFYIECKSYRDLQYDGLPTGSGHLATFWVEAVRQACDVYDKHPILIAKQNLRPAIVCLDLRGVMALALEQWVALSVPGINLHAVIFDDFLLCAKCNGL